MMQQFDVLSNLRRRIGNPSRGEVNDDTLLAFLEPHLLWLADELEYRIVTDATAVGLTASDYTYPLPSDCLYVLWVEWNGNRLTPNSIAAWTRDATDWRNATASSPSEYVVEGRNLLVTPPPSSDAITDDAFATLCYVAEGTLTPAGVAGLTDSDLWVAIYRAAAEWLGQNPGADEQERAQNAVRRQTNADFFAAHHRQAKQRREQPIATHTGKIVPRTRRQGAAR